MKRIWYQLKVYISINCNWIAESVDIEFVYHCEWNRVLLKLMIKHVKVCTQWVIIDI